MYEKKVVKKWLELWCTSSWLAEVEKYGTSYYAKKCIKTELIDSFTLPVDQVTMCNGCSSN